MSDQDADDNSKDTTLQKLASNVNDISSSTLNLYTRFGAHASITITDSDKNADSGTKSPVPVSQTLGKTRYYTFVGTVASLSTGFTQKLQDSTLVSASFVSSGNDGAQGAQRYYGGAQGAVGATGAQG